MKMSMLLYTITGTLYYFIIDTPILVIMPGGCVIVDNNYYFNIDTT